MGKKDRVNKGPVNSDVQYHLVVLDKAGTEQPAADGKLESQNIKELLKTGGYTDVFLMSHGWLADEAGARQQYDDWTEAMGKAASREKLPGDSKQLVVGIHWPSKPFPTEPSEPLLGAGEVEVENCLVEEYAGRLSDSAKARSCIRAVR